MKYVADVMTLLISVCLFVFQLLGMHFPSIYELGIQSLIDKGNFTITVDPSIVDPPNK